MKPPDRRTREQRKADQSALIAGGCLGAAAILLAAGLLLTGADAEDREVTVATDTSMPVAEAYNPAWDIPAEEYAYCNDIYLGEFTLTAYCAGSCCCGKWANGYTATGTEATEGRTIAVDPDLIPYGSQVLLIWPDGTQRTYTAEDCGGGINGRHIDVYLDSHEDALRFGIQSAAAYLKAADEAGGTA